uniref:CCHC-type domain-containing protein n=1 Tax=Heliothis virescens TaxID=7102 RepID=A0A2A4K3V2_HELVI
MQNAAQVQRRSAVSSSSKHRSSGKTWIRCYGCGEVGHTSADCPHKSKGLKCFKCNQFGHVGSACSTSAAAGLPAAPKYSHRTSSEEFGKTRQDYQHTKRAMFTTVNDEEDSAPSGYFSNGESKMAAFVYNGKEMSTSTKEKKPVIVLEINNLKLKALVDTGSDVNIILADVYEAIGKPKCEKDDLLLSGIGQSTVRSMG